MPDNFFFNFSEDMWEIFIPFFFEQGDVYTQKEIDFKDISDLAIFFPISNNYVYDHDFNYPDFDSTIDHVFFLTSIMDPSGFDGIFLDKFDSYMLGDMICPLFNIDLWIQIFM